MSRLREAGETEKHNLSTHPVPDSQTPDREGERERVRERERDRQRQRQRQRERASLFARAKPQQLKVNKVYQEPSRSPNTPITTVAPCRDQKQ